ncbi:unnamed protein product [Withania somnifera]
MASGRSNNGGSKGFDFASDDILCSYEDYANQDPSNGTHSDPVIPANSAKEFHKSRMTRSSIFPAPAYSPPEESSFNQDMISTVDKTMKKYADNLMRFLEGISSRLSQLELYCYNLDKSIGEMRSDLVRDHGEADSKLKALEKHVQEVHRSVQILRDKQELAETQKELPKLQLAQKGSASSSNSQQNEERMHGQQLALALPHQVAPQASLTNRPLEQPQQPTVAPPQSIPSQSMPQSQGYYLPPPQLVNQQAPTQLPQGHYLSSDPQYRNPQMQVPPQPAPPQVNQTPQLQSMPQYQQQWAQQVPQQVQQSQVPAMQQQARPTSPAVYSSYLPGQPNPSPDTMPNSMPMQVPFSGISQPAASRPESMPYGYDRSGRSLQQQSATPHLKPSFGAPGDGYAASGAHPTLSPGNAYVMYDGEGTRGHLPPQPNFQQGGYPPSSFPLQNPQPTPSANLMVRSTQQVRNHPYSELIEKLVSMGYRGDHVVNVIQRLEESGQPVDFNAILDRMNGHSSGGSQRGW